MSYCDTDGKDNRSPFCLSEPDSGLKHRNTASKSPIVHIRSILQGTVLVFPDISMSMTVN